MCVKYSSVVLDSCVTEDSGTSLAHGCSDYRLYRGGRSCVPSLGWSVTTRGSQAVEQQPDPAAAWAAASRAMWSTGGASAAFHRAAPARPHRTEPRYWFSVPLGLGSPLRSACVEPLPLAVRDCAVLVVDVVFYLPGAQPGF